MAKDIVLWCMSVDHVRNFWRVQKLIGAESRILVSNLIRSQTPSPAQFPRTFGRGHFYGRCQVVHVVAYAYLARPAQKRPGCLQPSMSSNRSQATPAGPRLGA